jgi:ribonuclease T2
VSLRNGSRFKIMAGVLLLTLLAVSAAGCEPSYLSASDTASLATDIASMQPTKQPTRAATKNAAPSPTPGKRVKNTPGDFDFYVLSLSWSPDYCAGSNVNDPQQCSLGKKLGFVLHGLWPQYNRGYPADCSNVPLPKDAQQKFPNLFPSSKLYTHEWDKHGTCSGLTPAKYMTLARMLKESLTIPTAYRGPAKAFRTTSNELKAAFVKANMTLNNDALAVQCSGSGRYMKELYVCFSREGQPVACSKEVQNDAAKSCGRTDFLIRNVR